MSLLGEIILVLCAMGISSSLSDIAKVMKDINDDKEIDGVNLKHEDL